MLPCRLYPGYVSIYGAKSINNITAPQGFQFGKVNQIYDNVPGTVSVDQSVLFRNDESIIVAYSGAQYFLIPENKIVLIEDILS